MDGTVTIDPLGRQALIVEGAGAATRSTVLGWDQGRVLSAVVPDANQMDDGGCNEQAQSSTLDPRGNPVAVTDANGTATSARYDGLGRLTGVWLDGRDTAAAPDRQHSYRVGEWAQGATASANSVTTWALGPDGQQLASAVVLDGQLRTVQQQATGNPTQRFGDLDPDGDGYADGALITSIICDARGLAIQVQGPYYSGQQVAARDAAEPGLWLPVARAAGLFPRTDTSYDGAGRARTSTSSWPEGTRDTGSPDPGPSATTATTTFSYDGLTTTAGAPSGGIDTSVTTDPLGRQTLIVEGSGAAVRSTVLGWDGLDRPTSAASGGLSWTRGYDGQDRVLASSDPDRGGAVARYTATGEGTTRTTLTGTGLIRLGARDYDPSLGVFTTTDPLSAFGNPGSLDPYAYSRCNPLAGSDPDGTWPTWKGIKNKVKSAAKWAWDHMAEIAGAVAAAAATAAVCAATAGVGCLIIGGAIAGAVGSATTYGIQVATGQRKCSTKDFLITTGVGAVVGLATAGLVKGGTVLVSNAVRTAAKAAPGLTTAVADTAAAARATLQRAATSAVNRASTALKGDTGAISFGRGGVGVEGGAADT